MRKQEDGPGQCKREQGWRRTDERMDGRTDGRSYRFWWTTHITVGGGVHGMRWSNQFTPTSLLSYIDCFQRFQTATTTRTTITTTIAATTSAIAITNRHHHSLPPQPLPPPPPPPLRPSPPPSNKFTWMENVGQSVPFVLLLLLPLFQNEIWPLTDPN